MISIIIPTYNEARNITDLVLRIKACLFEKYELIIIDDASPDGTGAIAERLAQEHPIKVVHRGQKLGLASAVLDGFKIASGELLCVIDSDLSHPPEIIPLLVKDLELQNADIIIASRFLKVGGIGHWPKIRLLGTNLAMLIVTPLVRIKDPMSGFFILKKEVLLNANLIPRGFKILLEILVKGRYKKAVEFPFVFIDRVYGHSKLNLRTYLDFIEQLFDLYLYKMKSTIKSQYVQYCIALFVLILTIFLVLYISPKRTHGDFDVYYASSQSYLAKAPVYTPHHGIEEFKYSPLFALVFSPLTLLKSTPALYVWNILNISFLYSIFYLFYKLKQISFSQPRDLLIIICLFALTGRFIFCNIELGQINILLCFLMVLTMYLEVNKKYFWAAVTLAFSLMIKLFPLLFLVYFLLRRRFILVGFTILMTLFFLLLPSVYSGLDLNFRYLNDWLILLKSSPAILFYSVRNNSLLSFYSWLFIARHDIYYIFDYDLIKKGLTPGVYYAWFGTCFVFFSAFFYDTFFVKNKETNMAYLDYSCLFVCALLFNPLAYLNALIFLIVPYFFILRYLFYSPICLFR